MKKKKANSFIRLLLGVALAAGLIQLAGWLKGDRLVFPDIGEILRAFFALLAAPGTYGAILVTLRHLLIAVLLSTVIGVGLGLAEGLSEWVRDLLQPLMILLRSIPMIVLTVIIMVLLPYRLVPMVGTTLILVPLISEAACEGCRQIDRELIDVYRLNSALNIRIIWQVYLPLMAGYLRQAYRSGVGMGLKIAVTTEYLVQTRGSLGKAVYSAAYFNEYADIYAYALIMIGLVLLVSWVPEGCARLWEALRGRKKG